MTFTRYLQYILFLIMFVQVLASKQGACWYEEQERNNNTKGCDEEVTRTGSVIFMINVK